MNTTEYYRTSVANQPRSRANQKPDYEKRRIMAVAIGVGGIALAALLGKAAYAEITAPPTENVTVNFGYSGANNWDASKEIAVVEGLDPKNNAQVENIDYQLQAAEVDSGLNPYIEHDGDVVNKMNIPVAKAYDNVNQATGHGITVNFPEHK